MRISPALLLLILVILVFAPSIMAWATLGGTAWYRPYQLWLAGIIFVWWTIHRGKKRRRGEMSSLQQEQE